MDGLYNVDVNKLANELKVIIETDDQRFIPQQNANQNASGYDLRAHIPEAILLEPKAGINIPVGFKADFMKLNQLIKAKSNNLLELDITIRPKSSWSKIKVYVMLGTIDADWHGESECHIINLSDRTIVIEPYQKIGQMVFGVRLCDNLIDIILGDKSQFTPTNRDEQGFGSSGKF